MFPKRLETGGVWYQAWPSNPQCQLQLNIFTCRNGVVTIMVSNEIRIIITPTNKVIPKEIKHNGWENRNWNNVFCILVPQTMNSNVCSSQLHEQLVHFITLSINHSMGVNLSEIWACHSALTTFLHLNLFRKVAQGGT